MSLTNEIKVLDLVDVDVQRAFLVLARELGSVVRAKTWSYLLLGGDDPPRRHRCHGSRVGYGNAE